MKNAVKLVTSSLAALLIAATATGARAEGFGITEWSARGMSLANGMVARADDASAVAYNPAGITQIPGTTLMLGTAVSLPAGTVDTVKNGVTTRTHAKKDYWIIPHFYFTHQLNDTFWVGVGVFPRFGLGNGFASNWSGNAGMTDVAIHTVTINPNIVWKVNEHLSVAAGIEVTGGDLKLKQRYMANLGPYGKLDNRATLKGMGAALGGNLALHLRINDQWSAGLTYRSRMNLKVNGTARWQNQLGSGPLAKLNPAIGLMRDSDLNGTLCLPDTFGLGVAWKPLPNLSFEGDVFYNTWSNFRNLDISLESPVNHVQSQPRKWRDTWAFAASVEYKPLDWLALRAGYIYETSPMNKAHADYLVPSNGRQYYTLGAGFFWNNWTLDLAYSYIKVRDLSYNDAAVGASKIVPAVLPGKAHNVHAHNIGLSIGYKF